MTRVPCPHHRWHDVEDVEVLMLVAALTAELASERTRDEPHEAAAMASPFEAERAAMSCPREVLLWAADVEVYAEHVQSALLSTGAVVDDDETEQHGLRLLAPDQVERPGERDGAQESSYDVAMRSYRMTGR